MIISDALSYAEIFTALEGAEERIGRRVNPVKSPGGPVEPITLEQMQSFNAPVLSRNPVLHYVFAQMELTEERGLGLKSMKARAVNTRS